VTKIDRLRVPSTLAEGYPLINGWPFLLYCNMFTVYALYSPFFKKIYIGYTSDLSNRFLSHNKLATKGHTIKYRPWVITYTEKLSTKSDAIKEKINLKQLMEENLYGILFMKNLTAQMVRV